MKHLGDITKINGAEAQRVDIITGGSPCQDLSVAGKRAGLDGERSGLFMEQIRIIREMRDESKRSLSIQRTNYNIRDIKPRYMVWENVAGAFSSNNGDDFRTVLEETARITEVGVCIPRLAEGQRWPHAGCIMGDGWSIAWRLHDAQYWGVPQRRKRISLVADFGGDTAPKILFESKSVSGHPEPSKEKKQDVTATTGNSPKKTSECLNSWDVQSKRIQTEEGKAEALYSAECSYGGGESYVLQSTKNKIYGICSDGSNSMRSANPNSGIYEAETARTLDTSGGTPACNQGGMIIIQEKDRCVFDGSRRHDYKPFGEKSETVQAKYGTGGGNTPLVLEKTKPSQGEVFCIQATSIGRSDNAGCNGKGWRENQSYTLNTVDIPAVANTYQKKTGTLDCCISKGTSNQLVTNDFFITNNATVRRLTPMECERLQGFPDHWTDIGEWTDRKGKKHKDADAPRYKALGNSIALPFWEWMAERMIKEIKASGEEHPTMASLFDGIGGFPLVYSRHGCQPVWASEIEEFPIAVTKIRFPEEN